MTIRPIRSDADYEAGLARLETLMEARAGTPEGDELEVLSALIERFEDERFPVEAPSPLAAIRFRMEQENLSPRDLEPFIGTRGRVSEVLNGSRPLSIDMIRALHRGLGIPAESLIGDEPAVRTKSSPELSVAATKQLTAFGVLRAKESFEALVRRAFPDTPAMAMLRATRSDRTSAKIDTTAIEAWCAAVVLRADDVKLRADFKPELLDDDAARDLAKLSRHDDGPQRVADWFAGIGVAFVVLPQLAGTHLDGAALKRLDGAPIVALTLRHDRVDNFWFTLLHEAAHVRLHLSTGTDGVLDDLEMGSTEEIEKQADEWAGNALIPPSLWEAFHNGAYTSTEEVVTLARQAGVHRAIVAGRWRNENRDFRRFSKMLGHGEVRGQLLM